MTRKKDVKFFLKLIVSILLISLIIGYSYLRTKDFLRGVTIEIYEPKNNTTFTDSAVKVKGKITRSSAVFLNDRKIFLDAEGNFNEELLLSPGYNIITVRAEDRFKRETERKIELVYKQL